MVLVLVWLFLILSFRLRRHSWLKSVLWGTGVALALALALFLVIGLGETGQAPW